MIRARLLCALALALLLAAPASGQNSAEAKQNQQQLDRVRNRIQALQRTIERNKVQQDELARSIEASEQQLGGIAAQVRKIQGDVDAQQGRVREVEQQQARAQAELAAERHVLGRQVRAAYAIGKQGQAKLLLNQGDSQKLGRVLTYYDYLNRARTTRVADIDRQLRQIAELASQLHQQITALTALKQTQEQALVQQRSAQAQRAQMLSRLRERLSDELDELKQLQDNEKAIHQLLESLRDVLADIPVDLGGSDQQPFPGLKGRLPWPARGKLLATYGQAKAGGRLAWNGLWIDAPEGAPVKAVAKGRVAYVGWMHRYGLIVIVEHEGGYFSLYGHNQSVAKGAGDGVAAGEVIAAAGSTGGHEQPGVYFEVRKGTTPINPQDWLVK
ncbi:MAG TPA: peptidoglycan DD-metalloendopeptidase family protein [Solimonas sp.]|nr:peptidoglycan DD-metalloendopeptidase family protein [Solimonas sp.]